MNHFDEKIIGRDYIGIVVENNGLLEYQEKPIVHNTVLIHRLLEMSNDNNSSVIDIQKEFENTFPAEKFRIIAYNYLYPYTYDDYYLPSCEYPDALKRTEEIKQTLVHLMIRAQSHKEFVDQCYNIIENEYDKSCAKMFAKSYMEQTQMETINSEKDILLFISNIIVIFNQNIQYKQWWVCKKYLRYIFANEYTNKLNEIKKAETTKMYSSEICGWKKYNHIINEDFTMFVSTNLGYGKSSYFFCNLQYKNVKILPYSAVVNYYLADWTTFVRYTRRYQIDRCSWRFLFDYVIQTCNLAKNNFTLFKKEILLDIETMVLGLIDVFNNPQENFERLRNIKDDVFESSCNKYGIYKLVRNISNDSIMSYHVFPEEKTLAYKVEKISGCLELLDNLYQLNQLFPEVKKHIETIINLNIEIKKIIPNAINQINANIDMLKSELEKETKIFDDFVDEIFDIEILRFRRNGTLFSARDKDGMRRILVLYLSGQASEFSDFSYSFFNHKRYNEAEKQYEKTRQIEQYITYRENFIKILSQGQLRINNFFDKYDIVVI